MSASIEQALQAFSLGFAGFLGRCPGYLESGPWPLHSPLPERESVGDSNDGASPALFMSDWPIEASA